MGTLRQIAHSFFMLLGALMFLLSGISGIFTAFGICAMIWGNDFLKANADSIEFPHFSLWFFALFMVPFMLLGFAGGLLVCRVVQAYAEWKFGGIEKEQAFAKIKPWLGIR